MIKRPLLTASAAALAGGLSGQGRVHEFVGNEVMTERAFSRHLSERFLGVTTEGSPIPGLYSIASPVIVIELDHQGSINLPRGVQTSSTASICT